HEAHEGRTQTIRRPAHAGSRLKLRDVLGRLRLKGQPSSRTGENSPYGMIGGIEETSASFEARSAPRSYPTIAAHYPLKTMIWPPRALQLPAKRFFRQRRPIAPLRPDAPTQTCCAGPAAWASAHFICL